MGDLVVQPFVSADGFAADARNEFDLFDVVRLVLLPVALGSGRGVFPPGSQTSRLRLIGSETVGTLVAVDYAIDSAGR